MKKIYNYLLELLFPSDSKCIFCDEELESDEHYYCKNCEKDNILNNKNTCIKCDCQITGEGNFCSFCMNSKRYFIKAVAPFIYGGEVRNTILKFKDNNAKYLSKIFAELIAEKLNSTNINFDYIIPVPITKKSLRKRHYNQSKLLADDLGKIFNIEVLDILSYRKETDKQKSLNYNDRIKNMEDAFEVDKNYSKIIKNKKLLIVDDIITTCATINNCAKSLSKYSKNIFVCSIARKSIKI